MHVNMELVLNVLWVPLQAPTSVNNVFLTVADMLQVPAFEFYSYSHKNVYLISGAVIAHFCCEKTGVYYFVLNGIPWDSLRTREQ